MSFGDKVAVDGKIVSPEKEFRYVLLNKPAGYVCSLSDEKGRPVASDLLKSAYTCLLYTSDAADEL